MKRDLGQERSIRFWGGPTWDISEITQQIAAAVDIYPKRITVIHQTVEVYLYECFLIWG